MKQRSNCGHFWPVQASERASTLAHAEEFSGSFLISAAIAGFGGLFPVANDLEIRDLFQAAQHRLLLGVVDLLAAGVVGAALHVGRAQLSHVLLQKGDVLEVELLLQILGAGGDDDAFAGKDGRDQVGQRLAGTGAGLDDQVLFLGQRGFHGLRHLKLALAVLIVRMPLTQKALAAKELANRTGFACREIRGESHVQLRFCQSSMAADQTGVIRLVRGPQGAPVNPASG